MSLKQYAQVKYGIFSLEYVFKRHANCSSVLTIVGRSITVLN